MAPRAPATVERPSPPPPPAAAEIVSLLLPPPFVIGASALSGSSAAASSLPVSPSARPFDTRAPARSPPPRRPSPPPLRAIDLHDPASPGRGGASTQVATATSYTPLPAVRPLAPRAGGPRGFSAELRAMAVRIRAESTGLKVASTQRPGPGPGEGDSLPGYRVPRANRRNDDVRVRGLALARSIIISRSLKSSSSSSPSSPPSSASQLTQPSAPPRAGLFANPVPARRSPAATKQLAEEDGANRREAAYLRARRLRAASSPARRDAALSGLRPLERLEATAVPLPRRPSAMVARISVHSAAPRLEVSPRPAGGASATSAAAARRRWSVSEIPKAVPQRAPLPRQ